MLEMLARPHPESKDYFKGSSHFRANSFSIQWTCLMNRNENNGEAFWLCSSSFWRFCCRLCYFLTVRFYIFVSRVLLLYKHELVSFFFYFTVAKPFTRTQSASTNKFELYVVNNDNKTTYVPKRAPCGKRKKSKSLEAVPAPPFANILYT